MTGKASVPTKLGRLKQILNSSRGEVPHPIATDEHSSPDAPPQGNYVMQNAGAPDAQQATLDHPGPGQVLPPAPRSLAQIMQPPPVPQNFEGADVGDYQPPSPIPDAGPIANRNMAQLPDVGQDVRPQVAMKSTFAQEHPGLARILKIGLGAGEGAAAGAGSMTFGEGYARARELPIQLQTARLANEKTVSQIADTNSQVGLRNAETAALINGKRGTEPQFDKAGNIIGFRDQKGNLIGPKSQNLTQDMRDMIDAAEQRATAPTTPEGQVMAYLVKKGKTPAEAYGQIKSMQQENKPDTAAQNKQQFQGIIAKLSKEGGNALDPSALTDPRKLATSIQRSTSLTPDEKNAAQSYLAANTTPAMQIMLGQERGASYGQTRQYSVLDTKNGNRPGYVSADELNRANKEEPGRYLASGPGVQALNKENLMEDIRGGIQQVRSALENPNMPDFTAKQKVKIAVAMRERDPRSAVSSLITGGDIGTMTPEQEDYLIAHSILAEQAMAMRTVLGAGQGSQDLRSAITATFPGPTTPTKAYGIKQLDAFEKTVDRLERGIPNVPLKDIRNGGGNNNPTPAPQGMINVQIPGHPPGHIPASAKKQFLQDNPGAQVLP
jgi:hypothetical protein